MTTEAESIKGSTDDAWGFRNDTLIGDLKIPAELVDDGLRVGAEIAYSDWLQKNTGLGWFALHVMSVPCVYVRIKLQPPTPLYTPLIVFAILCCLISRYLTIFIATWCIIRYKLLKHFLKFIGMGPNSR